MGDLLICFLLVSGMVIAALFVRNTFYSFPAQTPDDYEDTDPEFDLRRHLDGPMICEGTIFGPTGRMTSTFVADFDANWDGDVGVIDEVFTYNNGEQQTRQWTLKIGVDHRFTATAPDVRGTAKGRCAGPVVILTYAIELPESAGGHVLNAFDCMYLTDTGTIVNRSQFRKFGIKVAELVATIRPREP